eukprot:CAMPEP_0177579982 /NCGR_PEP_ID=MMETSP0419_2-20121207/1282_1 /TAXON_ID=582737 /ORGANISM="Tetraselmis sp., Strain GSL018" /LENGTH=348 /DNA_ID=CAMNT_0019068749 /DNA_START=852 /DNA_END=1895 /DNA_ORIENTATION=+
MVNSAEAKLLATRKVTTDNRGKKTAGVDKEIATTPNEKMELALSLKLNKEAAPIRRTWIPKPGKAEKRPLGIPTIRDRAKQALVVLAIEPEWEAKADNNSYGFRPGRSCQDSIEAIFASLRNTGKPGYTPKYVFDADLKGCFDNIDHDYILKKLDAPKCIQNQIEAWLKAGIVEGFPNQKEYENIAINNQGTPQGGIISPLLSNIALDGMEAHLKDWIAQQKVPGLTRKQDKRESLSIIRYADDFVVMHRNKEIVEEAKNEIRQWLARTSKLTFNEEKSQIIYSPNGFNFLGFRVICVKRNDKYRFKAYPTKKAVASLLKKVGDICKKGRALSSYDLIVQLRPIIQGW